MSCTIARSQPALEFLDSAYMLWDNIVNKAYRVKGEIQPLQNAAADRVRKDIANFGEEVWRPVDIVCTPSTVFSSSRVFPEYGTHVIQHTSPILTPK